MISHRLVFGALGLAGTILTTLPAAAAGITGTGQLQVEGKCFEVPDWDDSDGTTADIWDCNGGSNQEWVLETDGTIRPAFNTNKCLDLPNWETSNGTNVNLWDCNGGSNQQWSLSSNGSLQGYGGACVDNPDWQTGDGTPFDYWQCNGGTNQQFSLVPADSPPITLNWNATFPSGVATGGHVSLSIYQDGTYNFSDSFHDSGFLDYNLSVACIAKDSNSNGYSFTDTGFMHGTESLWLGGSRDTAHSQSGSSDAIKNAWWFLKTQQELHGNPISCTAKVNTDLNNMLGQFGVALGIAGVVLGVAAL